MEVLSSRGADDESAAAIRKLLSFFLRLSAPPLARGEGSVATRGTVLAAKIVTASSAPPVVGGGSVAGRGTVLAAKIVTASSAPPVVGEGSVAGTVVGTAAGGHFWKMSFADTSSIDSILERPKFTLEELLDDDHIIQESKGDNEKLLAFLTREEVLAKLIQCECAPAPPHVATYTIFSRRYVITATKAGTEDKVKLKYPYVASELLSLDVESVYGPVLRSEKLSRSLFGFLRRGSGVVS
jgi:hypothetical protein